MRLPGHFLDPPAPRNEHEARVAALMILALWLLALLFLWRGGAHSAGGEEDQGN